MDWGKWSKQHGRCKCSNLPFKLLLMQCVLMLAHFLTTPCNGDKQQKGPTCDKGPGVIYCRVLVKKCPDACPTQWRYIVHVINSNQGHALYSVKSYGGRTNSYPGLSISLHPGTRLAHTGFELTTLGSWVRSSIPLWNGACFNFWPMRNPPGQ